MNKESIRSQLRKKHTDAELKTWFDPLNLIFSDSGTLEVRFPHVLFSRWFDKERRKIFEGEISLALGLQPRIVYAKPEKSIVRPILSARRGIQKNRLRKLPRSEDSGGLFSFATFIYNKKNEFAVSVAMELARHPKSPSHVPLLLMGKGTCGKTHLLRAIAREISANLPEGSVFIGTAAELNAYYRECADSTTFKREILRKKALLIDNANEFSEYPELQQEMVFITDTFKDKNKPMVLVVDSNLDHNTIDRQLRSRLIGGLVLTLKGPDLDVRLRYAKAQCAAMHLHLKKDTLLLIVQRFHNFLVIQGIIAKILAYEKKTGRSVTETELQKILADFDALSKIQATPENVITLVAEAFELQPGEIIGSSRNSRIVKARQVAMYLCRELLGISLSSLGQYFNGKNHATVLYACKKIGKIIDSDKDTNNLVTQAKKKFLSQSGG